MESATLQAMARYTMSRQAATVAAETQQAVEAAVATAVAAETQQAVEAVASAC